MHIICMVYFLPQYNPRIRFDIPHLSLYNEANITTFRGEKMIHISCK